MSDKIIFVGCEICPESANIINAQLLYLNSICDKDEDVKLFINTPGGDVDSGLAIVDTMNFIVPDISTIVMGMSASMGSIISSSGTRGKRFILPHSKILIHQPMGGVAPGTQESDFAIAYEQIKQCKDVLYKILAENTGKTVEEITADADRDHGGTDHRGDAPFHGCFKCCVHFPVLLSQAFRAFPHCGPKGCALFLKRGTPAHSLRSRSPGRSPFAFAVLFQLKLAMAI
jgi:ATP-dependent Clp protease protease subunit